MNAPAPHWSLDPAEVDRLLDGEVGARDRVAREAEVAADPALARRVANRRELLATLARAAGAEERDRSRLVLLETRVRSALAKDRGRLLRSRRGGVPVWTWGAAAAAVLVLWLGASRLGPTLRSAEAAPCAMLAADVLRQSIGADSKSDGGATCGAQELTSPFRFPLVERREMAVRGCIDESPETPSNAPERAVLYRVGDLQTIGYVAVHDVTVTKPGAESDLEIGVTRLDDLVVFDVRQGGAVYYLALQRDVVDRRGSCAACHGRAREGEKSPHLFQERRVPTACP